MHEYCNPFHKNVFFSFYLQIFFPTLCSFKMDVFYLFICAILVHPLQEGWPKDSETWTCRNIKTNWVLDVRASAAFWLQLQQLSAAAAWLPVDSSESKPRLASDYCVQRLLLQSAPINWILIGPSWTSASSVSEWTNEVGLHVGLNIDISSSLKHLPRSAQKLIMKVLLLE